jgi:hypothetical protein
MDLDFVIIYIPHVIIKEKTYSHLHLSLANLHVTQWKKKRIPNREVQMLHK